MRSIKIESVYDFEIEKSRFIGVLRPIDSVLKLSSVLNDIKDRYPQATHYCYALKTMESVKFSDDGEPSGTAGKPLLDLLEKKNITNAILIVIRYFGGVKLGAARLLRTYVNVANSLIDNSILGELKNVYRYAIIFDYANTNEVERFIKEFSIVIDKKEYGEKVTYYVSSFDELSIDNHWNFSLSYLTNELITL